VRGRRGAGPSVNNPLRLVVFDLDGTLVGSRANIMRAVSLAAERMSLHHPPPELVPRVIGLSLGEALARLFPSADVATRDAITRMYRELFTTMRARADYSEPLFPGVHDLLADLEDAGVLLGIATGKGRQGV